MVGFASSATENASSAIVTCDHVDWFAFAMNATMALMKADVSFVEAKASRTHIIARNAQFKKKIEMDVPKLSIWGVHGLTCSMNGKNMVLKNDN